MPIKKIIAIIDPMQLVAIEKALGSHGVTGFTIFPVKGSYCNTFSKNGLVSHIQIELYTAEQHALPIAELIMQTADVGVDDEGIIAIQSVEELFRVKGQTTIKQDELKFFEVSHG